MNRMTALSLLCLLALAAFWRVLPHPDNMTPVMAVALFGGLLLRNTALRFLVPLGALFLSDLVLGLHATMPFVYVAMLVPVLIAPALRGRGAAAFAGASLVNSLSFFLITNLGVWAVTGMYAPTLAGLAECFLMALPFLWKTVAGDLFFTLAFLALFSLTPARLPVRGATV